MEKSNRNNELLMPLIPKRKRKSNAEYCKKYCSKNVKTEASCVALYRQRIKESPSKLLVGREKERNHKKKDK